MTTLKFIHSLENNSTVRDVLNSYFDVDRDVDLISSFVCGRNELIDLWATNNNVKASNIVRAISSALNETSNFKVIKERGFDGCWPECMFTINDYKFKFDWLADSIE